MKVVVKMLHIRQYNKTLFSVHNEMMKQFRRSHGRVATLPSPAVNEQDIISRTHPMVTKHVRLDNGGIFREEKAMSWFICPSLPKVAGYKLSQN